MTARLEQAMRQLTDDEVKELEDFAEFLAVRSARPPVEKKFLSLNWAGCLANDYPEHQSGVEAAHAANQMRIAAIEKNLSR